MVLGPWRMRRSSELRFVPPTTSCTPKCGPWNAQTRPSSAAIWLASSRVGDTMTARMAAGDLATSGMRAMRSIVGNPKPRVLPVPVRARARRSWPASAGAMVAAWTGVANSYPKSSSSARWVGVLSPGMSANRRPAPAGLGFCADLPFCCGTGGIFAGGAAAEVGWVFGVERAGCELYGLAWSEVFGPRPRPPRPLRGLEPFIGAPWLWRAADAAAKAVVAMF